MPRTREFVKETILDQAIQLFSARGYEATSIRDLIDLTGVSSSSLYEVFGDKRGLFLAALERYCGFERARITQMAAANGTPQRLIEELFTSVDDIANPSTHTQRSLAFNTMIELGTQDAQITQLLLAHYVGIAEIIARVLSEAQTNGTITTRENPLDLAYTILGSLQGLGTVKSIQPTFEYGAAITRMMLKLLDQ